MPEVDLSKEIRAFETQLPDLQHRFGAARWVVFLDEACRGDFPSFSDAIEFAMREFPDRDFLVRSTEPVKAELPFLLVDA
jgi:hypothetical protein